MSANDYLELREIIRILERKLGIVSESELSCCGVSFAQCHALVEIGRASAISLIDLAEILCLDSSTLSRTVNGLVDKGLARRDPDPSDRRYIRIGLTEEGTKLFLKIEEDMQQYYHRLFDNIPKARQAQVLESLHMLVEAIDGCCKE